MLLGLILGTAAPATELEFDAALDAEADEFILDSERCAGVTLAETEELPI
ncbi:hypothetical protein VC87395_003462 [Vibrio paracholerae 87395]|nr:hypothetical protein FORC55_3113 [Vibrio cholerae]EMP89571.1 hypothetical protein VC87395_003462 [Vibrio paracholerae 87395]